MQPYLTWRALLAELATRALSEEQLDEPLLFALQDAYGTMQAYPVQLLADTAYQTLSVGPAEEETEYELLVNGDPDTLAGTGWRALRPLPPRHLLLHFSEMDEDVEQCTRWLGRPNPHTPPPPPPRPGPAPLFEQ